MAHLITQNQIKVCDLIVANVEVVHLRSTWYNFHLHVLRTINIVLQWNQHALSQWDLSGGLWLVDLGPWEKLSQNLSRQNNRQLYLNHSQFQTAFF